MIRIVAPLLAAQALSASVMYSVTQMGGVHDVPTSISQNGTVGGHNTVTPNHGYIYSGSYTDIGRFGSFDTIAYGVNDSGHAAGAYNLSQTAAFYDGTSWVSLSGSLGTSSQGRDINNAGQMTGSSGTQAFLRDAGGSVTLIPGMTNGMSINAAGQIAGRSSSTNKAVVRETDGTITNLGLPGTFGQAYSISDAGHVVGIYVNGGVGNGFLYTPFSGYVTLTGLGGQAADARGVNSSGVVVGQSDSRAFVVLSGVTYDLNSLIDPSLGIRLIGAVDVNDAGQIIAFGIYDPFPSPNLYGFLLTPLDAASVPEPGSTALAGAGLAAMAWLRARRHGVSYPRPTSGMVVAITVRKSTLASGGRFAI